MAGRQSLPQAVPARLAAGTASCTCVLASLLASFLASPDAHAAPPGADCSFRSRQAQVSVPAIRPEQAADVIAGGLVLEVGDCLPSVQMQLQTDQGQHASAGRPRMKHLTRDAYLPYTFTLGSSSAQPGPPPRPQSGPGRGRYLQLDLRIRIPGSAAADLPAGDYQDRITLTVTP